MATINPANDPGYKYSVARFTGDGGKTDWDFNFAGGYVRREHIKAYTVINGVYAPLTYTWVGDNTVRIAPAVPIGVTLVIRRETPKAVPLVNFTDAAIINETNLDTSAKQAVFVAAEIADEFEDVITAAGGISDLVAESQANSEAALAAALAAGELATQVQEDIANAPNLVLNKAQKDGSDISPSAFRTNLGLGNSAVRSVGTVAGTVLDGAALEALETGKIRQFGAGAVSVSMGEDFSHVVRPSHYRLTADGSNAALAINRAISACRARGYGEVWLENGQWDLGSPIINDNSGETGATPLTHVSIIGPGSASCNLRWAGAAGAYAIQTAGGVWGGGSDTRLLLKGFTLSGLDARPVGNRLGIRAQRTQFLRMEDLYIKEFYQAGWLTDIVGAKVLDCNVGFNTQGFYGDGGLNPVTGSAPNEWTIARSHFGHNTDFSLKMVGVTNLLIENGSFEAQGLGVGGGANNPNAIPVWLIDPCYNGAGALNMISTHFESNTTAADVHIDHGVNPGTYNFYGNDFFQLKGDQYSQCHVRINSPGASPYKVNFYGTGFGWNTYGSPVYNPAGRPLITRTGVGHVNDEVNNYGCNIQSGMVRPQFTNEQFATATGAYAVAGAGAWGAGSTYAIRQKRDGNRVTITGEITVPLNGTGSGLVVIVATGYKAKATTLVGLGRNNTNGTALAVQTVAGTQNLEIRTLATNAYPIGGNAETITFSATYEAAD